MRRLIEQRLTSAVVTLALLALAVAPALAGQPLFMWQVKGDDATISLVGSIHVGRPDFFPLAEPFETAFAGAAALAVEVDAMLPANQAKAAMAVMQRGMLPEGESLQDQFEPELWTRLEAYAAESGTPLAMFDRMKPGIVVMMLVMQEYQRQGFDAELGIDKHFLDAARETGKEIRELETLDDQLDIFFSIDDKLDDIMMAETLDQMADVVAIADEMVELWKNGDVDGLDTFLLEQIGEGPEMEAFYKTIMTDRNVGMAEKIDAMLRGDEDVFVVVGAGHFAGKQGIVQLLRDKGWKVEQITH